MSTKEHGLPFMDRLVRAIADGEKTETRRLIGWHNGSCESAPIRSLHWSSGEGWPDPSWAPLGMVKIPGPYETVHRVWCRYEPGDTLWIREAWGTVRLREIGRYLFGGAIHPDEERVVYRAGSRMLASKDAPPDYDTEKWPASWAPPHWKPERWRPSIHMPRTHARYLLRVEEVRAERLHEITDEGALREGIYSGAGPGSVTLAYSGAHRDTFLELWDQTNGHRAGARSADNPLVWVIRFSLIEP